MSEEIKIPEEVQELQSNLQKFAKFKTALHNAMFKASDSSTVTELTKHVNDVYSQIYAQLDTHPFVVEYKKKMEAQRAEDEKLAAEIAKEMQSSFGKAN